MKTDNIINQCIKNALNGGATKDDCLMVVQIQKKHLKLDKKPRNYWKIGFIIAVIVILFGKKNPEVYQQPRAFFQDVKEAYLVTRSDKCILGHGPLSIQLTHPLSTCELCVNLTEVYTYMGVLYQTLLQEKVKWFLRYLAIGIVFI